MKNRYKKYFCLKLSYGIDKLFQSQNKYTNPNIEERHVGDNRYFYLQKNDPEFEVMKNFILDNFYTKKLDYEVKAIVQYQAGSLMSDPKNINFIYRPIFFIKETEENKKLEFTDITCDKMMAEGRVLITTENLLTQNLDNFFSNEIRKISFFLIVIGTVLLYLTK